MTLQDILIPTYVQMLGALSCWLTKAEDERPGAAAEDLLRAQLAPDMFPLSTQIRFACVQALEGVHRLLDRELPPTVALLLDEGRNAGTHPGTLAEARTRIAETVQAVEAVADASFSMNDERAVAHELPMGMTFDLTGAQYARDWALPQFYFHLMSAYAILRAQGVTLGKADYVAHMFAYLRPGDGPVTPA